MNSPSFIEQIETRMRPGQWSAKGFLGVDESLEKVILGDRQTLTEFDISYNQIADKIEQILKDARDQYKRETWDERRKKETNFPDLYRPETLPSFSIHSLPDVSKGFVVGNLQVFLVQYRGFQECPWGCEKEHGSCDILVLNRNNGHSFTAPELAIHLIRAHQFFEGFGTPFRVDPLKVIQTLELKGE